MLFAQDERTALFIDGPDFYGATRSLGFDVDYGKLLSYMRAQTKLVRAHYYGLMADSEEYSPVKKLTDWLAFNGYNVSMTIVKDFGDPAGRRRARAGIDVRLAVSMMESARSLDHLVLFSSENDLRYLVEAVQRQGPRVSVVSTIRTAPPLAGEDLRRQADQFIDLADISAHIARRQTELRLRPGQPS